MRDGREGTIEPEAGSRKPEAGSRKPEAGSRKPGDLRVPVGDDAWRWRTFPGERLLVAAARTVTSAVRLLDVLPDLVRGDPRVDVVFAFDPTSAFGDGVHDLLHAAGVRLMPWDQLSRVRPHLVVSASENIDTTGLDTRCPVLVLPHGIGFHKLVPDARGSGRRLSGVMDDPRARHAVSHPDQIAQLAEHHPGPAARARLIGDPYHDGLLASRPLRARYRAVLGAGDDRRLVLITSTWGPQSLLGRDPHLPARLAAALPLDEYRVAAVLHPNVWSAHSPWQVRAVEAAALDGGLLLVPPERGWPAALVAADVVVGDHGSVTLYAAALGRPLLLAAFGEESVPGTPMAELGRVVPHLQPHEPLAAQLERAVDEHDEERVIKMAAGAFTEPGSALLRLRSFLYELMALPEPDGSPPPRYACPAPRPEGGAVTAAWVTTTVTGEEVSVRRLPASGAQPEEGGGRFLHLSCDEDERDLRLLGSASALTTGTCHDSVAQAVRWALDTLAAWPGARLATAPAPGRCVSVLRDGRVVETSVTGRPPADAGLHAAVVYAHLRAGRPPAGTVRLRAGVRDADVVLSLRRSRHVREG
ncbi:hypothetical protein [Streptomyces luteosporeus]|uniref:Translation initiation factor 2 n=2 Tax=Streptomyces TaxID=1883 RepID=A0ABN3TTG3_9ACTN